MDVLELVRRRRSVKAFTDEPVKRDLLESLIEVAVWAPNHKLTEPWLFYVLGDETRGRFAKLRRDLRARKLPNPDGAEAQAALRKVLEDTMATPALVAVSCAVAGDPVRRDEDYAATAMAVQNLLIAAWSLGLGSYLRTGEILEHPEARALLGVPDDHRLFGVISLGRPADVPQKTRTPAREKTRWLP
ncbi:MAG: nitroreductase family protein [Gemmatimonadota bacterium]